MDLGEAIVYYRKQRGMTIEELVAKSGVPKGTLNKITNGITGSPKFETIKAIADALGVSLQELDEAQSQHQTGQLSLSPSEQSLIKKYRALDEHGKKMIDIILEHELARNEIKQAKQQNSCVRETPIRQLPLYDLPASAGTGVFLDSNNYEMIDAGPEVSSQANFAVTINGNSMEPKINDGDIVWVKQQPYLDEGRIGIFILNGEGYCKKYFKNKLVSLNPVYEDILINEYDELRIVGEVL